MYIITRNRSPRFARGIGRREQAAQHQEPKPCGGGPWGTFFSKHWTAVLIVSIDVDSDDSLVAL